MPRNERRRLYFVSILQTNVCFTGNAEHVGPENVEPSFYPHRLFLVGIPGFAIQYGLLDVHKPLPSAMQEPHIRRTRFISVSSN